MEIYGSSTTYNLENVLRQNILGSDYYRQTCSTLNNWSDIVDEIYENVDHVEPWMSGNARGASSAFCLLHRLFTLKLIPKQIKDMLDHRDSPYIRAVGFLYLRYVADPKTLWSWCASYVKDQEMFAPSGPEQKEVTMGDFVRDLLLSQYYFETIFPRIPKPVQDVINEELKSRNLPTTAKGNGGAGGTDRRGVDDTGNRRPASVKASLSVAFGQRAPNRSGAREEGRGRDPSATMRDNAGGGGGGGGGASRARGSASPDPPRERDRREPPPARRDYDRDRDGRDRGGGADWRDRSYDRDRRDAREPERGRDRGRDDDRGYDRNYDRDRARGRTYDDHKDSRRRSRSRSRDRRDGGRDARDVFRDSAARDRRGNDEDARAQYGGSSRR
ncbi:hypothetical protein PLESTB_000476900 [Pleodorina starrii]|uniref:Pre-mRNA-splicing factor 38 n=1 Tax=Pleodorina starrii TaxID=330485 RepID=A0A9W6BG85_9CHLO|nr:hypothetical protein PLESTM_001589700 [Pleodorina starrii]GLC51203.1 hypothetical protein PLESTB_000476900 [Pleodorina starrii]GLC63561.1 hypothetical protein PLESTF_000049400 [Pleodorina starrii]